MIRRLSPEELEHLLARFASKERFITDTLVLFITDTLVLGMEAKRRP